MLLPLGACIVAVLLVGGAGRGIGEYVLYAELVLALLISMDAFRRSNSLLHPCVWFPPPLVFFSGGVILYQRIYGTPAWYMSNQILADRDYTALLILILLALAGFWIIYGLPVLPNANGPLKRRPTSENAAGVRRLAAILLYFTTALLWFVILKNGAFHWLASRGANQYTYDAFYYIKQFASLVWFPAYGAYAAAVIKDSDDRRQLVGHAILFVGPLALRGDRYALVLAIFLVMVPMYHFRLRGQPLVVTRMLIAATGLVTLLGIIGSVRGSLWRSDATPSAAISIDPLEPLLGFAGGTGGVIATTLEIFPAKVPFLLGSTLANSAANLIPSAMFGGARPFANPSLMFRRLYRPDIENHGLGFAFLAESYMNFGLIGAAIFSVLVACCCRYYYRRMKQCEDATRAAMYAIVIFQTLWFLRGDSTVFLKTVVYSHVLLAVLHRLSAVSKSWKSSVRSEYGVAVEARI